jgi:hypothetical protein
VTRPAIFIGSSSEGRPIARAIRSGLEDSGEITIWDEGAFGLGSGTLESLTQQVAGYDFAILVLTPDDMTSSRGTTQEAPRDNVLFECGLFVGGLGRHRTFVVVDSSSDVKLPSDLAGITIAKFRGDRSDANLQAAVGTACDQIRASVTKLGTRDRAAGPSEISVRGGQVILQHRSDGWWQPTQIREHKGVLTTRVRGTVISVVFGRIEDLSPIDTDSAVLLPANEYFDDDCIHDNRSALGAFMQRHFEDDLPSVRALVDAQLRDVPTTLVQKASGIEQRSYGVGTCVFLDSADDWRCRIALGAVTTQRANEGLRSELPFIFAAVRRLVAGMCDRRLHKATIPILGSGHGGLSVELAFFGLVLALAETAMGPSGGQLRVATIVVFQNTPDDQPVLSVSIAKEMLKVALGLFP